MIGLQRGTVRLTAYQEEWREEADRAIQELKRILGNTAIDIQHIGSTAIPSIHAKPILDIAIGVREVNDVLPYREALRESGFVWRGEDVPGQLLLVMGDFEKDIRTHHVHVVKWNGDEWNHYINFLDYLNAFPEKASIYDACKQRLAVQFSEDRKCYTEGKKKLIETFLEEAELWWSEQSRTSFHVSDQCGQRKEGT